MSKPRVIPLRHAMSNTGGGVHAKTDYVGDGALVEILRGRVRSDLTRPRGWL
jgi:hypothetical protein